MSEDSNKNKSGDTNTSQSSISSSSPSKPAAANSPNTNISSSTPVTKASPSTPRSKTPATTTSVAKKEPEPPLFEKELVSQISSQLGDKVKVSYIRPLRIKIYVDPVNIVEVASFLRDSMAFDHAESVAGTD